MEELLSKNKNSPDYFFVDEDKSTSRKKNTATWRRIMPLIIAVIGIGLMIGGIFLNRNKTYQNISSESETADTSLVSDSEFSRNVIMVDVSGAVERPGIVETNNDSRIQDVLISAGGLSAKADRTYVSKNINLAQRVFDGMKLYFPFEGETLGQAGDVAKLSAGKNDSTMGGGIANGSTLTNINTASDSELDRLPGVGPITASKIIAARPYQNVSELLSRKIIGKNVFEKIKGLITTN